MEQTIIPSPIAWIVTQDEKGILNIAPFSYFMGLSSEPPSMIINIGHKSDGSPKDTLKNIRESKKCTIFIADDKKLMEQNVPNAINFIKDYVIHPSASKSYCDKDKENIKHSANSIENGSKGNWKAYHGVLMPKFNNKLTQQDAKTIAEWIINDK